MQAFVVAFSHRICNGLENTTFEQKRKLVELLIDRVVVKNKAVEIQYVIPLISESEQIRFVICVKTITIRQSVSKLTR